MYDPNYAPGFGAACVSRAPIPLGLYEGSILQRIGGLEACRHGTRNVARFKNHLTDHPEPMVRSWQDGASHHRIPGWVLCCKSRLSNGHTAWKAGNVLAIFNVDIHVHRLRLDLRDLSLRGLTRYA